MAAAQIYSIVNTIANNIGYTGSTVVDTTSFVAFGQAALTGAKEAVYNELYNLIGRTVIAIDEAEDDGRGIVVDAFSYGSILQKISFQTQAAESSSEWDIANPENPYLEVAKTGIVAKYFENKIPTFSWKDVAYDTQLQESFRDPQTLAGFTDALFTRMRNAYKRAKLGLADAAIGSLIAYIYDDSTDMNASRRVRHLFTEFTTNYTQYASLTQAEVLVLPEYLEYVRKQILIDKVNLNKLTHLYNTIGASGSEVPIDRRSSEEDLKLDLSLELTASYAKYYGDTYNEQFVQFPRHSEVVNWGIATDPNKVVVSLDGGSTTITVDNILGVMYDRDAVVATMDRERFVNIYDQWNDRNVFKLTANRRYICDPTENAIIYLND